MMKLHLSQKQIMILLIRKSDQVLKDFLSDLEMDYHKTILRSKISAAESIEKAEEFGSAKIRSKGSSL